MHQLVQKDTERPDVKLVVVLAMVDHLRRHILECAAESIALAFIQLPIVVHVHF